MQIEKAQKPPKKLNLKRSTQRHTIMKLSEVKDRIVKATREKQLVDTWESP